MADVSRNVVAVLLVLVILVSGLGTWNLLSTASQGGNAFGSSEASVSLTVNTHRPAEGTVQLVILKEASHG